MASKGHISRRRQQIEIAFYTVLSAGVAFAAGWYLGLTTAFEYAKGTLAQ